MSGFRQSDALEGIVYDMHDHSSAVQFVLDNFIELRVQVVEEDKEVGTIYKGARQHRLAASLASRSSLPT